MLVSAFQEHDRAALPGMLWMGSMRREQKEYVVLSGWSISLSFRSPRPTFPSVTATGNIPEGVVPSARPFNVVQAEPPADPRETHSTHDKSTSVVLSH